MENYQKYIDLVRDGAITFLPKLLLAILIVIVGFWIVKRVEKVMDRALERSGISPEIRSFLHSFLDIALKMIVLLVAAGKLGFDATSLVALLAAAGFAVGMALQGFLGNFASGITIVFFRPYKVGDWVNIGEQFGKVESIQLFNTTLVTPGQKTLIIPNGKVTDDVITNFSTKGHIRLELNVTMPYSESYPKVKKTIQEALRSVPSILQDPEPDIGIETYDSHSIVISVRPLIDPDDYWIATFDVNQSIKRAFNANNIKVSYSEGVEMGDIGE